MFSGAEIKKILPSIQENVILAEKTAFKIGGPARYFFVAKNKEDLIKAIKTAKQFKLPFFILGGGSNILFPDEGYNGLIIKLKSSLVPSITQNNKINVGAGVNLMDLVTMSLKKSFTGLEWAIGIPGTVGGAVYGNTGAFGRSISDIVDRVYFLDVNSLKIKSFSAKNCRFSFKNSIFKKRNDLAIISVSLKFKRARKKKIQERIKENLAYRKKTQPSNSFSAGCFFQNYKGKINDKKIIADFPELKNFNKKKLIPAGYLIDKCGLKGKTIGRAQISKKHANFILNLGGARARDVIKLIKLIKEKVKNKFRINIKEEVKVIHT